VKTEPRHNKYGLTISEWIQFLSSDLDDIGIGLAGILDDGRYGFELKGPALVDFVRRCLYALVERGAKPRHWGSPTYPDRNIPLHYGNDTNEEIVEGVIADWIASGAGDLEYGDFWFLLPENLDD
jgi:hypothetical protein